MILPYQRVLGERGVYVQPPIEYRDRCMGIHKLSTEAYFISYLKSNSHVSELVVVGYIFVIARNDSGG